jgi:hypothetical protein
LCYLAGDGSRLAAAGVIVSSAAHLREIERPARPGGRKLRRLAAAWRLARRREGEALPEVF